jgi:limonene-1,2-epoxide hydrolase
MFFTTTTAQFEAHGALMNIDSRLSLVGSMEKAVLEGDQPSVERYLASDIRYTVGARPTVVGPRAVILAVAEQEKLVHWDGHTFINAWLKDDALVVEVISHFKRLSDGRQIPLPCTDIYRFTDNLIVDWRVYADMAPFTAP